jgi:hypothetical protein
MILSASKAVLCSSSRSQLKYKKYPLGKKNYRIIIFCNLAKEELRLAKRVLT